MNVERRRGMKASVATAGGLPPQPVGRWPKGKAKECLPFPIDEDENETEYYSRLIFNSNASECCPTKDLASRTTRAR